QAGERIGRLADLASSASGAPQVFMECFVLLLQRKRNTELHASLPRSSMGEPDRLEIGVVEVAGVGVESAGHLLQALLGKMLGRSSPIASVPVTTSPRM